MVFLPKIIVHSQADEISPIIENCVASTPTTTCAGIRDAQASVQVCFPRLSGQLGLPSWRFRNRRVQEQES